MIKSLLVVFIVITFAYKARPQNFGALPYTQNPVTPFSIERVIIDSIHNKLIVSSKYLETANGKTVRGICSWDGSVWDSLSSGINTHDILNNQPNGTVQCGIRYNGKFLVGGLFESIGGINATSLATWDGVRWDSLPVRAFKFMDYGASVYGFLNYSNRIYIYGQFDTIQGQKANGLATFDGISFQPIILPAINNDPTVMSMCLYKNELYIGGNFYTTSGNSVKDIFKFNGTLWESVGGSIKGSTSSISSLVVYKNELYAGGYFLKSDGNAGNIIMKWDGTSWHDVGWGDEYNNGGIWKLLVHHNKLYAFGTFELAGNNKASRVASFDGNQWCTFSDTINQGIFSADIYNDTIYVTGAFKKINSDTAKRCIAKILTPTNYNHCENVGFNEQFHSSIRIHPNPTTSSLHISDEQNDLRNSTIEIANNIGQTILQIPFQETIDVSTLPEGCYFITITTPQKQKLYNKFVKD